MSNKEETNIGSNNKPEKPQNKYIAWVKNAIKFITHDIWIKRAHEYPSSKHRWWAQQAKLILFTARGVSNHNTVIRSAALTYYTTISLVPILALAFAVSKGFGLEERLSEYLYTEFPEYNPIVEQLLGFANNMLERTRAGVLAAAGVLVLFWSVIKVLSNVEKAFNNIWDVRKPRSVYRMFIDYLAALVIAPILLILANSTSLYVQSILSSFTPSIIIRILFFLLSIAFMTGLLLFIYKVMPNTKVRMKAAFIGAVIAGPVLMIFQTVYFALQSSLSNYNAIYGTFAAIPLFLIWLLTSWQIVLFGAEISFAYQNIESYEFEKIAGRVSYNYRKKVIIAVMYEISNHYIKHTGLVSSEMIASRLELPLSTVRQVIYTLLKAKFIIPVNENDDHRTHYYIPIRDPNSIRVFDIIRAIEDMGDHKPILEDNPKLESISKVLARVDEEIHSSDSNIKLTDLNID